MDMYRNRTVRTVSLLHREEWGRGRRGCVEGRVLRCSVSALLGSASGADLGLGLPPGLELSVLQLSALLTTALLLRPKTGLHAQTNTTEGGWGSVER